jgi:hypothetical protein
MWKGGHVDERNPIPSEYREYILASRFHWSHREIEETPGHVVDYMLALDQAEREVRRG